MSEPAKTDLPGAGARWIEWYGWGTRPLAEAQARLADALGLAFEQREESGAVGVNYWSQRADGELVWVVRNYRGRDGRPLVLPEHPDHETLVLVRGSRRWGEVDRALARLPGLTRLLRRRSPAVAFRNACYGWGQTPLAEAAETLGRALGLDFVECENIHDGVHFGAGFAGAGVTVVENAAGLDAPQEPDHPEHETLVYVETWGAGRAWWDRWEPVLAHLPGLVLLRREERENVSANR
jgi:hypothetical protein